MVHSQDFCFTGNNLIFTNNSENHYDFYNLNILKKLTRYMISWTKYICIWSSMCEIATSRKKGWILFVMFVLKNRYIIEFEWTQSNKFHYNLQTISIMAI